MVFKFIACLFRITGGFLYAPLPILYILRVKTAAVGSLNPNNSGEGQKKPRSGLILILKKVTNVRKLIVKLSSLES
jgi:hypothetical protein